MSLVDPKSSGPEIELVDPESELRPTRSVFDESQGRVQGTDVFSIDASA